ncbi:hypothetical protein OZ411_31160 [Bradyrhizobium sp. Arg237L]|uniref:hypothetical protein n=1 Tax=Bradyrhizobium sp. Arg237L TaxID=3003352 RepID=UPI00249E09A0|nr:hypothetical protein [Bradyrhizobium sp. Arg237L]MDI4237273.1 hypothetical protein [Bradyrhizobium sp. Arg237L]
MTNRAATLSIDQAEWRTLFLKIIQHLANFARCRAGRVEVISVGWGERSETHQLPRRRR